MKLLYLAHAITQPTEQGFWDAHYDDVCMLASELVRRGFIPIVPTRFSEVEYSQALEIDRKLIRLCDGVVVHQSDFYSEGVEKEIAYAKACEIPVYSSLDEIS